MSVYVYCSRGHDSIESPVNFGSVDDANEWIAIAETKEHNSGWHYSIRDIKWRATPARFVAVEVATVKVTRI